MRGMNGRCLKHGSIIDKTTGYSSNYDEDDSLLYRLLDKLFTLPVWVYIVLEVVVLYLGSKVN